MRVAAVLCVVGLFTGCSRSEAKPKPPSEGTIFFAGKVGSEGRLDDLYALDVRTGRRRNLTRTPRRYEALPSVSPDRRRIAFYATAPNELHVLDLRTARRTRLGSGADLVSDASPAPPSWSPDGTRIAFGVTSGCDPFEPCGRAEIWVVGTGGGGRPVRLSRDGRVASWSPDGRRLAWWDNVGLEGVGSRAMVWDAGTGRRRIVGRSHSPPVWLSDGSLVVGERVLDLASGQSRRARTVDRGSRSPDGAHVAFSDEAFTGVFYVRRVEGGTFRFRNVLAHAWSPTGNRLAILEPFDGEGGPGALVSTVNPDGSGRRPLGRDHRNFERSGPLLWATRNLLVYGGHLAAQDTELLAVAPDGGRPKQLTRNDISELEPVASPDGAHLAFVRVGSYYDRQIWFMRTDGSEAQRLAALPEVRIFSPTWSPDGDEIAFARVNTRGGNDDGSPPDLFTMRSDGSALRQLTRDAWATDPSWASTGKLAYMRSQPDCRAIWIMEPGEEAERLTDCDFYAAAPAWAPDGKRLAFLGRSSAEVGLDSFLHLYVIDSDGGDLRLVARDVQKQTGVGVPNDEPSFDTPSWSPDGRRLVYGRNAGPAGSQILGLYVVGADGGRPVRIARGGRDPFWTATSLER